MNYMLPANNLYGDEPIQLDFPSDWNVKVFSFAGEQASALSMDEMRLRLRAPMGCLPIHEAAKGAKDAVIIVEDISRPTPLAELAEIVIEELLEAGVPKEKIRFVFALGSHRAMYYEDFVRKLGRKLTHEYAIYNHNPFFNNVFLGRTSYGLPVELNAECVFADFKVGIGTRFPHPSMGMGGAAKLILPGIASMESIRRFHICKPCRWTADTPILENTFQAAEMLGLNMKIDTLLNGNGKIAQIFAGECRSILKETMDECKAFYRTPKAEKSDVVIMNDYFKPSEPNVPFHLTGLPELVKDGGDLIIAANSPQGCAPHYCMGIWGDTLIGGPMNWGPAAPPANVGRLFAFFKYMDKGGGKGYMPSGKNVYWMDEWDAIRRCIGSSKKTVAVYPYATVNWFDEE